MQQLLNFPHHANILGRDEVDGNTLSAETATTTNAVDVVFTVSRQVIVDDEGHLLHVDTTGKQISGNKYTRGSRTELLHDKVTLSLVHVTVHGRDGEVTGGELVSEPVNLSACVAENDGLGNSDSLVQIRECIEFPFFLLNSDGKLVFLDEDTNWVAHELGSDLEDILRHRGREKNNLGGLGKELEDIIDLFGETTLGNFVKNKHLHAIRLEEATLNHVLNAAGGADDDLGAVLQSFHIITDAGTTNAGMAFDVHKITDSHNHLLNLLGKFAGGGENQSLALLDVGVDLLENRDGESGGLASTRLGLRDNIVAWGLIRTHRCGNCERHKNIPLMTGMIARCWIAEGRSKP
ncbi:hypothetical protein RRF57_000463 [Xylaria bambusicola]|uniref:Uncharacterized protein n=1 Tax=Xylaria bambusicola TaxID=326684 RepID=A0AAN7UC71_9PEZI